MNDADRNRSPLVSFPLLGKLMELDVHLMNIAQVLNNIKEAEKNGSLTPLTYDLKKLAQAVNYLLETSCLNKEVVDS